MEKIPEIFKVWAQIERISCGEEVFENLGEPVELGEFPTQSEAEMYSNSLESHVKVLKVAHMLSQVVDSLYHMVAKGAPDDGGFLYTLELADEDIETRLHAAEEAQNIAFRVLGLDIGDDEDADLIPLEEVLARGYF